MSWLFAPNTESFWYWTRNIIGMMVAVTVVGESFHYIPKKWLPCWLHSDETHHNISKKSWIILVVALSLEVPVEMIRDNISRVTIEGLESSIESSRQATLPRNLTTEQISKIVTAVSPFRDQQFSGMVASGVSDAPNLWVSIDQALGNGGWKREPPWGLSIGDPPHGVPISPGDGVALFIPAQDVHRLAPAANALTNALQDSGIKTVEVPDNGPQSRTGIIVIEIGTKP